MAKLTNFIYCLRADNSEKDGGVTAVGVMNFMMPEFVPGTFSFSIIFSILGMDILNDNKIQIVFSKKDKSESPLVDTGEIIIPKDLRDSSIKLPDNCHGLTMSMDFRNVVFEEDGVYNTEIRLNGVKLDDKDIYVIGKRK